MPTLDFNRIGKKIKSRRESMGITQEMVANYLDVNPSHISNIECGHAKPSLSAIFKIANFLQCSVDFFITEEYTYNTNSEESSLEDAIIKKLHHCTTEQKERLLKIMDLI